MYYTIKELKKTGLNITQAKVYLAVLKIGRGKISHISTEAKIPRASVYDAIPVLMKMGLLTEGYNEKGKKYYKAESPERLYEILDENKKTLSEIVPDLLSLFSENGISASFEVMPRLQAVARWQEIVLRSSPRNQLLAIGDPSPFGNDYSKKKVLHYWKSRSRKGIRDLFVSSQYILCEELQQYFNYSVNEQFLRKVRYLPKISKLDFIFECIDEYVYIKLTKREKIRIILSSKDCSTTFREIFYLLWDKAKNLPRV